LYLSSAFWSIEDVAIDGLIFDLAPPLVSWCHRGVIMATGITDMDTSEMTQPEDVAELVATLIALPNTASVPEITVNWRYEGIF
jgi:hypothetical protein